MLEAANGIVPPIEKEDIKLFHEYEEAAIKNVYEIFDARTIEKDKERNISSALLEVL